MSPTDTSSEASGARAVSPFADADLCELFGFTLPPGRTGPVFGQLLWPFHDVIGLPAYLRPSQRHLDFAQIRHAPWRLTAMEYIAAMMAPHHEAVRDLPHALRVPQTLMTCHGRLGEATRWFNWLTRHGVTRLDQVSEHHCLAYCDRRSQILGDDGEVVGVSTSTKAAVISALSGLAQYRELFSGERYTPQLRPFHGASPGAASGRTAELAGENKIQPLPAELLQPLLAAVLYLTQTLGPHVVAAVVAKQRAQARHAALPGRLPDPQALIREVERLMDEGEPLVGIADVSERLMATTGRRKETDPLAGVSLSALARAVGVRQYQGTPPPQLRAILERAVGAVGVAAPYARRAALVERADGASLVPWTEPLTASDIRFLVGYLITSCCLLISAASGMRHSELRELAVGCRRTTVLGPGLVRYRLAGRLIKGQGLGGLHDEWVVTKEVYDTVGLLEQLLEVLHGSEFCDEMPLFSSVFARTTFKNFRTWVNGPAGQRLGLSPIPLGDVTARHLRRTLAVEIAYRPGGLFAAKLQLKHISVATTEGYAARPGGAQSKFLAEIGEFENRRNLDLTMATYADYRSGIMPSGPGARDLIELFASVDGRLDELATGAPLVMDSDEEVRSMLNARAQTLHLGHANYCWFVDPAKALCLRLAGTPNADKPLAGMCDSVRCPQATHHACHRPVWEDARQNANVFIGGLSRRQKSERVRLEAALARAERVLGEIDGRAGGAQGSGVH